MLIKIERNLIDEVQYTEYLKKILKYTLGVY